MRAILVALLAAATALAQWFDVNPSDHGFGQVQVGDTVSFSFYVTNTGNDTGNVRFEMSGIGQGLVLDPQQAPYVWNLAPGDSAPVAVLFQPSGSGYRHRVLVGRWSIFFSFSDVSGTGTAPDTLYPPQQLTVAAQGDSLLLRWQGGGPFFRVYASTIAGGPYQTLVAATRYRELRVARPDSSQLFYVTVSTDQVP